MWMENETMMICYVIISNLFTWLLEKKHGRQFAWQIFIRQKLLVLAVPSGSPQNVAPLLWLQRLGGCHDNGQVQQSLMDNLVTDVEMGPKWAEIHQARHCAAAPRSCGQPYW